MYKLTIAIFSVKQKTNDIEGQDGKRIMFPTLHVDRIPGGWLWMSV